MDLFSEQSRHSWCHIAYSAPLVMGSGLTVSTSQTRRGQIARDLRPLSPCIGGRRTFGPPGLTRTTKGIVWLSMNRWILLSVRHPC